MILILENVLGAIEGPSLLREARLPNLLKLTETGEVRTSRAPIFEAEFFGIARGELDAEPGVLMVSSLGFDPPPSSLHFNLSLLECDSMGCAHLPQTLPFPEESAELKAAITRLNTKRLTVLLGRALDHALVWEDGPDELSTVDRRQLIGQSIASSLPRGTQESYLRRFIDDSVNILTDLDLNRRRLDNGFGALNLLWPWGQGFRPTFPNLTLTYGRPLTFWSEGYRFSGCARLLGLRSRERDPDIRHVWVRQFNNDEDPDLAVRELRSLDSQFLEPLVSKRSESSVAVIATGGQNALVLRHGPSWIGSNAIPFDERVLEDSSVQSVDVSDAVRSVLSLP